ncbi:MAG: phosphatase PAP2 family protein [bacterium]|nr:phosphatase PAP2 family protein [bacterium]
MNESLFLTINFWAGQNYWLDRFMIFFADWLGYLLILGIILCYLKDRQKYGNMVWVSLLSAIISRFVFVTIIRFFYYSPRPFLVLQNIHQLMNHEMESSFPSGHATFYFALATGVYLYNKKAGYAYFALAGLVSFARVFVGVHWPLDIMAGAVLGIATVWLINIFYKKYQTN